MDRSVTWKNIKNGTGRYIRSHGRQACALALCACMVLGGFPGSFTRAFASDGSDYEYDLTREDLEDAVAAAVSVPRDSCCP